MAINVIVASQHDIVRSGLRRLLDAQVDISVIGEAADYSDADLLVTTLRPNVSVVELSLVAQPRRQVAEEVIRAWSSSHVIIFSLRRNWEYVEHCLRAGARGYILAELLGSEIVDAVREVHAGRLYLSSRLAPEAKGTNQGIEAFPPLVAGGLEA